MQQKTAQRAQQGRPVHRQVLPRHKMIANKFAYQFTTPPIHPNGDKSKRQLKQHFHQLSLTLSPTFPPAEKKKRSGSVGQHGIGTLHLKKLAQGAISYLTNIFDLSISTWQKPETWHKAIIIQIPKPGKD